MDIHVNLYKSEYSKIEQLKFELKSKAIIKAKKQAEYLIEPLNQTIDRAIFISDKYFEEYTNDFYLDEIVLTGYGGPKQKQEYNQPIIEFKPIRVESQVTVKFAIE